jgi:iron-sulfur cluster assembly accessory protein
MNIPPKVAPSTFERLEEINREKPDDGICFLRISVLGGGCSGFQYEFELVNASSQAPDDLALTQLGQGVLIDETSLAFLGGADIVFEKNLIGARFVISNPNASSSCGCGTSFSM